MQRVVGSIPTSAKCHFCYIFAPECTYIHTIQDILKFSVAWPMTIQVPWSQLEKILLKDNWLNDKKAIFLGRHKVLCRPLDPIVSKYAIIMKKKKWNEITLGRLFWYLGSWVFRHLCLWPFWPLGTWVFGHLGLLALGPFYYQILNVVTNPKCCFKS